MEQSLLLLLLSARFLVALALKRGYSYDYRHHGQEWTAGHCGSRQRQSPIDFGLQAPWACKPTDSRTPNSCYKGHAFFDYDKVEDNLVLENSGHGFLWANVSGRGYGGVTLHDNRFEIQFVAFRAQSEHTFEGKHFPIELQLFHKNEITDAMLIVSVQFYVAHAVSNETGGNKGRVRAALEGLLRGLPQLKSGSERAEITLEEPADLLAPLVADNSSFFEYDGSLTMPPCTEQVSWLVRMDALPATRAQAQLVKAAVQRATAGAENWRSAMPSMGRQLSVVSARSGSPSLPDIPTTIAEPHRLAREGKPFRGQSAAEAATLSSSRAARLADTVKQVMAMKVSHERSAMDKFTAARV